VAIEIQSRDTKIMRHLFRHRVMTYEQISRKFFSRKHGATTRNRLRKLVQHGFLRVFGVGVDGDLIRCYGLTEKAWPHIEHGWGVEIDKPHFRSESVVHDIGLAGVVQKFEGLSLFENFLSENVLQSSSALQMDPIFGAAVTLQSDGVLVAKDGAGGTVNYAIEYEVSKKAPDRYVRKLGGYYQASGIDGVLYVCGGQEIADAIARADRKARTGADSIVYFASENSVLKSENRIIFKGVDHGGIGLS